MDLDSLTKYAVGFFVLVFVLVIVAIALPILQNATVDSVVSTQVNETVTTALVNIPQNLSYDDIVNITNVVNASNYQLNFSEYANSNFTEGTFLLTNDGASVNNTDLQVTYTYNALERNEVYNITDKGTSAVSLFGDWFKILILIALMVFVIGIVMGIRHFSGRSGGGF